MRVEILDGAEALHEHVALAPPASLLDLADLVDEAEADVTRHSIGRIPVGQVPTSVARRAFEERVADAVGVHRVETTSPTTADEPSATEPVVVLEAVPMQPIPVPSTEREPFQSVLQRLVSEIGDEPATAESFEQVPAERLFDAPSPAAAASGLVVQQPAEVAQVASRTPIHRDDLVAAILDRLELAPPPPAAGPGATIAIVGQGFMALQVAGALASGAAAGSGPVDGRWRDDRPFHVVFPSGRDAYDPRWRGPTIVAVDAPMGNGDLSGVAQLLEVLDADLVWGVVDATRKNEDIERWCVALGGVDVLALENLDATCSPAAVLDLGIPVGLLDGRPASVQEWTQLLAERVELAA